MEFRNFHLNVDFVGSSGIILNPEQKAALQSSLLILKQEGKFVNVYFWGKILGIKDDYYIVQGVGKDELQDRRTFYRFVHIRLLSSCLLLPIFLLLLKVALLIFFSVHSYTQVRMDMHHGSGAEVSSTEPLSSQLNLR